MKKALTQVGAFLANHNAVRFKEYFQGGGQHDRNNLKINGSRGQYAPK